MGPCHENIKLLLKSHKFKKSRHVQGAERVDTLIKPIICSYIIIYFLFAQFTSHHSI